jgi:hypothetical protein
MLAMQFKLRFTIRDLLWLTLVVALAVGWWLDHRRLTPWVETGGQGVIAPFPNIPDLVIAPKRLPDHSPHTLSTLNKKHLTRPTNSWSR